MASEFNWKRGEECDLCGSQTRILRTTMHDQTICVDSESCTISRQRQGLITKTASGIHRYWSDTLGYVTIPED